MGDNTATPPLCAKGCGFYGSTKTKNLCSKCYNNFLKQEIISKSELNPVSTPPNPSSVSVDSSSSSSLKTNNRCHCCNKKVGLLGFSCRCGKLLCGIHRYPMEHSCNFDFKTHDCLVLAKQNPVVKGDKLARI